MAVFFLCLHMVKGIRELFSKSAKPIYESSAFKGPNHLPKDHLQIPSHWGYISTYEFWRDTNIQSIANTPGRVNIDQTISHVLVGISSNSFFSNNMNPH